MLQSILLFIVAGLLLLCLASAATLSHKIAYNSASATTSSSNNLNSYVSNNITSSRALLGAAMPSFEKFWTPIDLAPSSKGSRVTLCQLKWQEYNQAPHRHAMFKDLIALSSCSGSNRKVAYLDDLIAENAAKGANIVPLTGVIFHESRVGSTLIANLFGTDPFSMVFAESPMIANALMHCTGCSRQEQIKIIRNIVAVIGASPYHNKLFFKSQSITSTKMALFLEAFPEVPWGFVYRHPVQTMMSQLDPDKGVGGPCLRSMSNPPARVQKEATRVGGENPPKETWCAAHLNMLCTYAIESYEAFSKHKSTGKQRGILINYEGLPGIIPKVVLPLFGVEPSKEWVDRIAIESKSYSKKNKKSKVFVGDSKVKEKKASELVEHSAAEILQPTYDKMLKMSLDSMKIIKPELYAEFVKGGVIDWEVVKNI